MPPNCLRSRRVGAVETSTEGAVWKTKPPVLPTGCPLNEVVWKSSAAA